MSNEDFGEKIKPFDDHGKEKHNETFNIFI